MCAVLHNMLLRMVEVGYFVHEDGSDVTMELFNHENDLVRDVSEKEQEIADITDLQLEFEEC